jgi:HEPN domain-containing protein
MDEAIIKHVRAWIDKANNDINNIEIILKSGESNLPTDTLSFHCQQAVEKLLKAYLISKNEKIIFTHNLADLVSICIKHDKAFESIIEKAEILTPFAVEIRYPDSIILPSVEEAKEFFISVLEIKEFITSRINL